MLAAWTQYLTMMYPMTLNTMFIELDVLDVQEETEGHLLVYLAGKYLKFGI